MLCNLFLLLSESTLHSSPGPPVSAALVPCALPQMLAAKWDSLEWQSWCCLDGQHSWSAFCCCFVCLEAHSPLPRGGTEGWGKEIPAEHITNDSRPPLNWESPGWSDEDVVLTATPVQATRAVNQIQIGNCLNALHRHCFSCILLGINQLGETWMPTQTGITVSEGHCSLSRLCYPLLSLCSVSCEFGSSFIHGKADLGFGFRSVGEGLDHALKPWNNEAASQLFPPELETRLKDVAHNSGTSNVLLISHISPEFNQDKLMKSGHLQYGTQIIGAVAFVHWLLCVRMIKTAILHPPKWVYRDLGVHQRYLLLESPCQC